MKKYNILSGVILSCIMMMCFQVTVFANSSWHWLTSSPMKVLPYAIILTLMVETITIVKFGKVGNSKKTFCMVTLANLLSFLAPYLERAYRFIPTSGGFRLTDAFTKGPYYIVLIGYLILTLLVELPVIYLLLKKDTTSKKRLALSVLFANIATTMVVAVIERIICIGQW